MRVTIKDVATKAGVSIKTVSRVINNEPGVAQSTRSCVRQAIEALDYRPNAVARSLIQGNTKMVALLVPDISDPFFPDVVVGAESVASQHGYSLVLCNTSRQPERELEYLNLLLQHRVDGFMICGSRLDETGLKFVTSRISAVILTPYSIPDSSLLCVDAYGGSKEATQHLISLGHRHIGHIRGDSWLSSSAEGRFAGFLAALEEASLVSAEAPVITATQLTRAEGYNAAQQLLVLSPAITAIACYNDLLAIGAIEACLAAGRRVPEDIAITGFDDIPAATMVRPWLTTMRIDRLGVGRMMMTSLLELMKTKVPGERRIIKSQLIVRESTRGVS
jgi:LacI family transcriptional regulator